jgi:hypothetical protein
MTRAVTYHNGFWHASTRTQHAYTTNGSDNVIHILDHATGQVLAKFGRPGNQSGDLTDPDVIAVNSKGDIIIGEVPYGGKLQMWRLVK